ncbi:nucleotide pyrophosphohydrolase [Pseudarthrobacter sulfonivorans]|uniref:Nucleotide pyrophosphohydrolase n=1 Tax=Pseudarthrobacter sulfonivorans TaxID=121292 RepID=A0A0U2X901_9MICC|nr:MazG nucleotide pyrophosphohydrolase domain-containing protein [Pseudarthrobacter sulfonivorans]ALV40498.1 nucleotide pyrophosphohydrolase [Pseudarthrobacter sulfonivorans]
MPTTTLAEHAPIDRLVVVVAQLREHCPWMGALTHASLVEYLLEEAFEVAETIETGADDVELRGELGDVLLQVVLHARLAEERGTFTFDDVARGLSAKMVRRNPHVFRPDGTLQDTFPASVAEIVRKWDAVKTAERPERTGPFEGIPDALPALAKAQKFLDRAVRAGAVVELAETPEVETATSEEELGDLLLAVVGSARAKGFDAERALRGAIRRQFASPS